MSISIARIEDVPVLVPLINSAYRGEASKKGWTTEAYLLEGDFRTNISTLTEIIQKPSSVILKYTAPDGNIAGSVYLDVQEKGLYLGMLTVSPQQQAGGIGKQLMQAAEQYAKEKDRPCVFMNVISLRHELIAWYERQGYRMTGEKKPVPSDPRFGVPVQPLEFAIMQKEI